MCRGKRTCTELCNPTTWSTNTPLPPPKAITEQLTLFHTSIRLAAQGQLTAARETLATFPNKATQEWCIEHGQVSGNFRYRLLGNRRASPYCPATTPRHPTAPLIQDIFERDRYHCRYCGLAVIPRTVLVAFGMVVGETTFRFGRRNIERHGAALVSWAQVDHVIPWSRGGATQSNNLVTSCWACNYGKDEYELTQIGLTNPFLRPVPITKWDGLTSLLQSLRLLTAKGQLSDQQSS